MTPPAAANWKKDPHTVSRRMNRRTIRFPTRLGVAAQGVTIVPSPYGPSVVAAQNVGIRWFDAFRRSALLAMLTVVSCQSEAVPQPSTDGSDSKYQTQQLIDVVFRADAGESNAQFLLGLMYLTGEGLPKDYASSLVWLRKAADLGHAKAQYFLGLVYAEGRGVQKDYVQATAWWAKAADKGHADAQFHLGIAYEKGDGVPENRAQAVAWYRKAAQKGHTDAQYNLGFAYEAGEGVLKDQIQAVAWYRKAAEQGHAGAQNNLGVKYLKGEGVPEDFVHAYAWFNLSAAQANPSARDNRDRIRAVMTAEQIAQGQALSREWQPTMAGSGN